MSDLGSLVLRVAAGLSLAFAHGAGKVPPSDGFIGMAGELGFPLPAVFAWGSGFAEFFCALLLAIGLFTRPASFFIVLNMLTVVFLGHAGDPFGDRELGLLYGVIAVAFLLKGSGRYSIDALLRGRFTDRNVRRTEASMSSP